ncbi:hypothetical protein DPX16_7172 [Anabarilius grahami]|uniref:Uncharacterized protein n=1 Tax=Anabarilius grahami TaxID=495550 RepID=A0A3N0XKH8_ANAGA|nr:hypothetical protein DPX16_7172 [Anabarilius grahami]
MQSDEWREQNTKDHVTVNNNQDKMYWQRFGAGCQRAQNIFSIQSRTAYKFLEVNPSKLSEAERIEQYKSIMKKLNQINPEGSTRAAITE